MFFFGHAIWNVGRKAETEHSLRVSLANLAKYRDIYRCRQYEAADNRYDVSFWVLVVYIGALVVSMFGANLIKCQLSLPRAKSESV